MVRRTDAALAAGFGLAAVATRWLHRGHALFSWDSGMLASGVVDYDFAAGHPHPPYYPLAIAVAKVLALWSSPVDGLVLAAVLSSGVLVAFTYLAARGLVGVPASSLAAALVLLSPTALFNGIAPLTYALEGASSAVVAWAAWRCRKAPGLREAVVLGVVTSIAIGVRPSSLFLVAPLALWGAWGSWRSVLQGAAAGGATTLAWLVPALVAGGGARWFLLGTSYQSRNFVFAHTVLQDGWDVVPRYAGRLASSVPWELPLVLAVVVAAAVTALVWWRHRPAAPAGSFLVVWLAPSLVFYLLVYDGWPVYPSGYVMPLAPAVAVLLAVLLDRMVVGFLRSGAPRSATSAALFLVGLLVAAPAGWATSWDDAVSGQREADTWAALLPSLRDEFPANETVIVTYYGWFWVKFGLPEYLLWGAHPYAGPDGRFYAGIVEHQDGREHPPGYARALESLGDDPLHPLPPWAKQVVMVYGPPTRGEVQAFKDDVPVEKLVLRSGLRVDVVAAEHVATIEQALRWFDDSGRPLPG